MDSLGLSQEKIKSEGVSDNMDDLRQYLTVEEVAKRLDLSEEWVRDLIHRKEIKAVKIGQWKIKQVDLQNFIKSRSNTQ